MTDDRPDVFEPEQGQASGEEIGFAAEDLERQDLPEADAEEVPEPAARARRGCLRWLLAVAASLLALAILLGLVAVALYNFGTMETPSAQIQTEYDQLVAQRRVPPQGKSPGLRIPIPGCRCHAADADIALKQPGRQPDVTVVIAHRYRTISQCMDCHGTEKEPAGLEGQPLEDSPAQ
jgi:hypothetical protein